MCVIGGLILAAAGSGTAAHATGRGDEASAPVAFESDRTGDANIVVAEMPTSDRPVTTNATTKSSEDIQPALSPEGRIAFASDRAGNYDIYATVRNGSDDRVQLTTNKAPDYSPAWDPENGWLAFVSERRGNADVFVIAASKSASAEPLTTSRADDRDPAWSPRGLKLAFTSNRAGSYDIWIAGLGRKLRRATRGPAADFEPSWSSDGQKLAFTRRNRHGNYDIYSLDLGVGKVRRLTQGPGDDSEPSWSPDGRQVAFTSNRDGDYDIYIMDANGTNQQNLSNDPAQFDVAPSWEPPPPAGAGASQGVAGLSAEIGRRLKTAFGERAGTTTVTCGPHSGTEDDDTLSGGPGDDTICGFGGDDTIYGGGGNDTIIGGPGHDRLFGNDGSDKFGAKDGLRDYVRGGPGRDRWRRDLGTRRRKIDLNVGHSIEAPL